MNRRDLIRTLLGTAAAGGTVMTATVTEAAPENQPFLLILESPGPISVATRDHIKQAMSDALAGTAFAGVRTIVLSDGVTLKTIGADGRLLTQPVPVKRRRARKTAAP